MENKINIALTVSKNIKKSQTFYFRLQKEIQKVPTSYKKPSALFVVGDLEGNFQDFCLLLIEHGIIDQNLKWNFADGHLVVMGSNSDCEPSNIECLWFLYALEQRAKREGGCLHFILGSQALKYMNGNWRFVHPEYASSDQNVSIPYTALYDGSQEIWRWLQTRNFMEQIGKALFVPAGINNKLGLSDFSISDYNSTIRDYLRQPIDFNNKESQFIHINSFPSSEEHLKIVLEKLQVKTIITSYNADRHLEVFYGGKQYNLCSKPMNGVAAGLLRKNKRLWLSDSQGKREKIK